MKAFMYSRRYPSVSLYDDKILVVLKRIAGFRRAEGA